ncbi:MAG TPA: site-2 protease family protein, partial [Solirubrobacterales bacterium]
MAPRFQALGHLTLFRRAGADQLIYAVPGTLPPDTTRVWLAAALFAATVLSVLFVGALSASGSDLTSLADVNWLSGVPYAVSLLAIVVAHEGGHYLMARRRGVPTSLPFLIPLPLPPIGTMGAVMQMKAPPKNRSALLAVGAAGPIGGLIIAIPVLVVGL